jgi:chemotaxis protein MotA
LSAPQTALPALASVTHAASRSLAPTRRLDTGFLAGLAIVASAGIAGIAATGVGPRYFLQPAGALIVLGGTLGVILLTTPASSLLNTARRVRELFAAQPVDREALIGQIISYAQKVRRKTLLHLEPEIRRAGTGFLAEAMLLAIDVKNRAELQAALETELRMRERHGEADARVLEVAGGFAPTLGILGTVVGLVDVLRQFSNLQSVGYGIGMAFVSTLYGLGLANLLLLPAAHRIRARSLESIEIQEIVAEGVLCIYDQMHPFLIRQRLNSFLRQEEREALAPRPVFAP